MVMKTALIKDSIKEIAKSFKRFISILLIVLLGVGFFAGIKATSPDMRLTLDKYFDDKNVMDFQVISTLGLTNEDIEELKKVDGIENVEGSYQSDAIVSVGEEDVVVKLETMTETLNELEIVQGRLPENENECVVEPEFILGTNHKIGDTIIVEPEKITDDDGNEKELLKNQNLTIVGTVKSPLYISMDRGSTKLGSGVIDYYIYISKENINTNIFTNAYVNVKDSKNLKCYENDYEDKIDEVVSNVEDISDARREARYNELFNSANQKLQDAKNEFETQKADGEKQLKDAEEKINTGKEQISDGRAEIQKNRRELNNKFAEAEAQIKDAKETLTQKENEYNSKKAEAEKQIQEYETQLSELKAIQTQYNNLEQSLVTKQKEYDELEERLKNLDEIQDSEEIEQINGKMTELISDMAKIKATLTIIDKQLENQGIKDINESVSFIESSIQNAKTELENAKNAINSAKTELANQETELEAGKKTAYNELAVAERKLDDSEEEIAKAEEELNSAREEYNTKIADAEKKLDEAEEEVNKITRPEWYILDRNQNAGYVSYIQDTDRVANLAEVFPVVFFIVAALISLTSMSRMVEEERVEIGTLKALGYNKIQIASKYLLYATLATVIGGIIGILIGFNLLPKIIADIYGMMYELPSVILDFNVTYATVGMLAAIACTVGATIYTCAKTLSQKPANLMRPKSPKPGKRVFLEYITFIWKRLNFTKKVTARNIFRYKKRFLMTIIGVGGCTALIIAGFGLRDAISSMIPSQYGKINLYEVSINLKDEYKNGELEQIDSIITEHDEIQSVLNVNVQSVQIDKNDNNQTIQLIVPEDINKLNEFITLESRKNNDIKYTLNNDGVIISEKISKLLDIKVGDEIKIINANDQEANVKVVNITENYLMHYIYMPPDLYNSLFDTRIGYNVVYANTIDMDESAEDVLGKEILTNSEYISGVSFMSVTEDIFADVMENMDLVVWILIIAAGLLAFVVLYNLLNANITERIRELATIKVLGFYDKEVYQYISRETIILTILGMFVGIGGGYFLTLYIIKTCELDILMFNPQITIWSYLLGVLITGIFAAIVNIITYFSLKKIDMIESLKSVE